MSSSRRIFYYLICLVTLGIAAAGVRTLLFLLFDTLISGPSSVGQENFIQEQLSLGLAMLIIGGPLWFFFWRTIQRQVQHSPAETSSIMRHVFLNLILAVTALLALFAAQDFLKWLLAGVPKVEYGAGGLATLIVTAAIWSYHRRIAGAEGSPTRVAQTLRRWYIYIAAGFGLVWLTAGLVQLIYAGVTSLSIWGNILVPNAFWGSPAQTQAAWIVLGGLWWWFHWFRLSKGDINSTLRQVYIYLLAIVGSSIAGLTALIMGLYQVFVWAFGYAGGEGGYFQFLGWVIPTIVVAAAVWSYHQLRAQEEASQLQEQRLSSKRVHLYIMSFIGLGTMVAGVVLLIGILLDLLADSIAAPLTVEPGWWQKQLSLCLALLIAAVPIWWYYWERIVRLSAQGGAAEWRARSRRIYLYVIIAAAIIGLAADLVNIIYQIMSNALSGSLGVDVLRNSKWSIQSLVIAAPLLVYHWRVARGDQRRGAEAATVRKTVSVLAGPQARELVYRLEKRLGGKVQFLQLSGPAAETPAFSDEELARIINEIESSPTLQVMVVIQEGKALVLGYQEKG